MKKLIYTLLLLLPLLFACQEGKAPEEPQLPDAPKHIFTVKASLPASNQSRTHITYGNPDSVEELFRWHEVSETRTTKDYISVFNVSRLSECPEGLEFETKQVDGREAIFESVADANTEKVNFRVKAGDVLFVNYWKTGRLMNDASTYDPRNIFTIDVNSALNNSQLVVKNPEDSLYMTYMQGNLKMYDIVTAVEDDKLPDIHFKHLSAIMRVTLRNETDSVFFPKQLMFEYPGTESFFNNTLYCSVEPASTDGGTFKVYDSQAFYESLGTNSSTPYTDIVTSAINNYTAANTDKGTHIDPGKSYDLYISGVPRIANKNKGNRLIIRLEKRLASDISKWYEMTLDGFDVPIEAGARYWFNLTAVNEDTVGKLVLTNQWLKEHPDKNH